MQPWQLKIDSYTAHKDTPAAPRSLLTDVHTMVHYASIVPPWADLYLMLLLGCIVVPANLAFAEAWWVEVQGVQLNAVDGAGNTALMDAIRHSHKEVQASLRAAGANLAAVNVADKLCLAAAEDDTPFLEVDCPTAFAASPCPTALTPASAPSHQTPCPALLHHPLFPSHAPAVSHFPGPLGPSP